MKYSKAFENLHLLKVENCWELYTNHGLHLNGKGKEVMVRKIVNVIKDILNVIKSAPIGIKWKKGELSGSIHSDNCETAKVKNVPCLEGIKNNRQANNERGRDNLKLDNQTELQPKRLRKVPIKRSTDFLWTDPHKL
jgi:hypothetical protein